ncbi:AAA family ATPase [Nocardia uniformis]|uniref:AAA family ATPase n=1 Tax=Nocardia uniformis TaxID=53432 RepID=A0A849BUD1_9NOCA|nr:AAA family ATPase [Nocardia uniformis]NNH70213.1 AAA family ATPase [Nocardia uniformis]
MGGSSLIGREYPVRVLREQLRRTVTSHGGLILVAGEGGIGKTTLITHVIEEFGADEALILVATAWSGDGVPGYWPWVQIVRRLRAVCEPGEWAAILDTAGSTLTTLTDGGGAAELGTAAVQENSALFAISDAVTAALVHTARRRPVFVVIDDLHRADPESVRVLTFLARHSWFERIALLAAVRDTELGAENHPLREVFAELWAAANTVELGGLSNAESGALAAGLTGATPPDDVVRRMSALSGGNPFLVEQAARLWQGGGPIDTLTPGARQTLEARLAPLPPPLVDTLRTAAVVGREFALPVVATAAATTPADLTDALDTAVRARLINPVDGDRFIFVHDLIRETLLARLTGPDIRRRHADVLAALEHLPSDVSGATPGDLAHHAYRLARSGDPDADRRALRYLLAAAADACGRLAAGEVAHHYRRALNLVAADRVEERGRLGLALAAAAHSAGQLPVARKAYQTVLAESRERAAAAEAQVSAASVEARDGIEAAGPWADSVPAGSGEFTDPARSPKPSARPESSERVPSTAVELFARAALGLHELGMPDPERAAEREIELIDEAHRMLVRHRSASESLAVRLLAAAARVRVHTGWSRRPLETDATAEAMSARALRLARAHGDPNTVGASLLARHDAIWRPGTATERLTLAAEIHTVAERGGDDDLRIQGYVLRIAALLELGDPRAHSEQAALTAHAERTRLPRPRFVALSRAGALATVAGRFDAAGQAIDGAYALGERIGEVDRLPLWLEQRWALALTADADDEVETLLERYRHADSVYAEVPLLVGAARRGDIDGVRRGLDEVRALLDTFPRHFHAGVLVALAQAALVLDDPRLRKTMRDMLIPLRELWAVVAGGGAVYGPYAYWLGRLAAAEGDRTAAVTELAAAAALARRLRAAPWVAMADAELDRLDAAEPRDAVLRAHTGIEPPPNTFRLHDGVWTLRFAGRTAHLPDSKGLRDLHTLISNPGQDISSVELLSGPDTEGVARATRTLGADTVLDERAKAEFRRRLQLLDDEIDRAVARSDDDRAAALDTERAALLDELRRAAGLGGRTRRLGNDTERARKTVSARVRDALRRLDHSHPELAEHLRARVALGHICGYRPQGEMRWSHG